MNSKANIKIVLLYVLTVMISLGIYIYSRWNYPLHVYDKGEMGMIRGSVGEMAIGSVEGN